MWCDIVESNIMMKGIWPEAWFKCSSSQHSTNGITDCAMQSFNGSILVRRVRCGKFNRISGRFEECNNVGAVSELTTLIHADIFVRNVKRKTISGQPMVQKINGRCFGSKRLTKKSTTVMTSD